METSFFLSSFHSFFLFQIKAFMGHSTYLFKEWQRKLTTGQGQNRWYQTKTNHSTLQSIEGLTWTRCGLVTPYGGVDLGHRWLKYKLVAWRHQAIIFKPMLTSYQKWCVPFTSEPFHIMCHGRNPWHVFGNFTFKITTYPGVNQPTFYHLINMIHWIKISPGSWNPCG